MKKRTKRLAILLSAVMIATMMPVSAFAEEIEEPSAEAITTQAGLVESDTDSEITEDVIEIESEIEAEITAEVDVEENVEILDEVIEEETEDVKAVSGDCGDYLTWDFDAETDLLTISQKAGATSGDMPDFELYTSSRYTPWNAYKAGVKKIVIKNGVTSIGENAFASYGNLEEITLPDSLKKIGDGVFEYCTSLKSVSVPEGVTMIGIAAFGSCSGLKSINLPGSLTCLEEYLFESCTNLENVSIANGTTIIGEYAFGACKSLKSIILPKSIQFIDETAFYACENLKSITLADGIETIRYNAFGKLPNLTDITVVTDNPNYLKELLASENANDCGIYYDEAGKLINRYNSQEINVHIQKSMLATPALPTLANVSAGVKITWAKVDGAENYRVFRKASGSTTWSKVGDTTSTTLTDTKATAGKTYYYSVCCISADGTETTSEFNETGKAIRVLSAITPTLANTSSGVSLKWTKAAGATGYYIYRKTGSGSFAKIKTITSASTVSYTDTAVKANNGTTYTYAVKAYYSSYTGAKVDTKVCRLVGKSISTLTNVATNKMVVKWTKDAKVTGYQIQYSKSSTFASGNTTSTITSNATVSKTIASLTRGSTYYVRMRTYKTVSGVKYYSAWSAKKYVKIAK